MKILKRNGFADSKTTVERKVDRSELLHKISFKVITKKGMNIGNLVSIEERYGIALTFVKALQDGNLYAVFAEENRSWLRGFKRRD